jgi:hypothetical protein
MATREQIKVGQRVRMRRSHDRIEFNGSIVSISATQTICGVETEPGNGSIAHHETVHFDDLTILEEPKANPYPLPPTPLALTEHQLKFLASRGYSADPEASARFIAALADKQREGFFAEAADWKEPDQGGSTDVEKEKGKEEAADAAPATNATA